MSGEIRERACRFGETRQLAGIVTEPLRVPRASAILVTAGLTPKAGPFRLYAQLARRLAAVQGLRVLRFDLGGIGDSVDAYGGLPLRERTRRELRAAADFLTGGLSPQGLILGGLCSGAEDSLRYAAEDPRVTGLFLLDAFGYRTPGWRWRDGLIRAARRGLGMAGFIAKDTGGEQDTLVDYQPMARAECVRHLETLLARDAGLHFVYTGGMRESFNHRAQFQAMFRGVDFRGCATVDYFPQLRHTQVLEADRRLVIESIERGLASQALRCPR